MMKKGSALTINAWKAKLKTLEEEDLPREMRRLGEAAPAGDWHENAEFEDAERQVELIRARIEDIKGIIKGMEKEKKK